MTTNTFEALREQYRDRNSTTFVLPASEVYLTEYGREVYRIRIIGPLIDTTLNVRVLTADRGPRGNVIGRLQRLSDAWYEFKASIRGVFK